MKHLALIALLGLLTTHLAFSGNLNVINLTKDAPLILVLSTEKDDQPFTVKQFSSSGPFVIGQDSVTLKTPSKKLPDLELPSQEKSRIAIMFPINDSVEWKLISSQAKINSWSFRVINLTGEAAKFFHLEKEYTIENQEEINLPVAEKKEISIALSDGDSKAYPHNDACSVLAILSKNDAEPIITLISDL